MFDALAVLRGVVLVYTVAVNLHRNNFEHPVAGWACVAVMAVWTVVSAVVYRRPERRLPAVLVADLALAVALLLLTPVVKGEWFVASIPGYFIVGALLAWAVRYGWKGGATAAVLLSAVDLLTRAHPQDKDWGNVFLILLGGSMVGFLCESLKEMAAERDRAQRQAAAAEERARLARVVHDGVLQVLAMVQRRGAELGGEMAALGRLAGEQEQALRMLIRSQDAVTPTPPSASAVDLAAALGALGAPGAVGRGLQVEIGLPVGTVELAGPVVAELVAVVRACLDNVARHVGEDARAWVLLEDLGDRVEVSVRDEGPGIPDGRLDAAVAEGRLGVKESICGRVADLGGRCSLDTGPQGTEWVFTVAREPAR